MKNRLRVLACLAFAALNVYGYVRMTAPDVQACGRWSQVLLIAAVAAATAGLAELIHRSRPSSVSWLLIIFLAGNVLASPLLAVPALLGWGVPDIIPNERGYNAMFPVQLIEASLRPAFYQIRLILSRNKSVLQGTDYVTYVIGTPQQKWFQAFQTVQASPSSEYRQCPLTTPAAWGREQCTAPGLRGAWSCFACRAGSSNHPQEHALAFSPDGSQAAYYTGTGRLFEAAARNGELLNNDAAGFEYRFPPASAQPDPAYDAAFDLLLSSRPDARVLAEASGSPLHDCLFRDDQACLGAIVQKDPEGVVLGKFLTSKAPYEREAAAIALAQRKEPAGLKVLLEALENAQSPDRVFEVADALGLYGPVAANAVPALIKADERMSKVTSWTPARLMLPLLRIGTADAYGFIAKCADRPLRFEEATAIKNALYVLRPPPETLLPHLRRWVKRQQDLNAPASFPLFEYLRELKGAGEMEPYVPWIRTQLPKGRGINGWTLLLRSLDKK